MTLSRMRKKHVTHEELREEIGDVIGGLLTTQSEPPKPPNDAVEASCRKVVRRSAYGKGTLARQHCLVKLGRSGVPWRGTTYPSGPPSMDSGNGAGGLRRAHVGEESEVNGRGQITISM